MASIKNLKKSIREICGNLASDVLMAAAVYGDKVDGKQLNNIINELAALQEDTIALASFKFDRSPKSFDSKTEYAKARRKYFKTAFAKLEKDFLDRAVEIARQISEALPKA